MHLAIVSDGVHPYVLGGMQRHTFYLCKYLSRLKVQITLIHYNAGTLDIDQLEIFSEEEKRYIESIVLQFPVSDRLPGHYLRASYRYSCLAYECLKDRINDFDFIYCKGFSGWKLIQEKQKNTSAFPPIGIKFHGYEMFQKQANLKGHLQAQLLRKPVKWLSRNADYVFSYGSKITGIIQGLGVSAKQIIEIPAGIEKDWIRESAVQVGTPLVFTYLGRYERRKGIEELNRVLLQVIASNAAFQFNFIGPFEDEQKLSSEQLRYFGTLTDNKAIKSILDETDVLVCPSWSEGMPNVILEGMARACAVIATDVGAVSLLVDSSNGFLIPPGNKSELKRALLQAIHSDKGDILRMKSNSLSKIKEKFIYDKIADRLLTQIRTIIKVNEKN